MEAGGDGPGAGPYDRDESHGAVAARREFHCDARDHSGCPHVPYAAAIRALHPRWKIEPDGRSAVALTLCGCECHAGCPMSAQPDGRSWSDDCTCNATLRMRHQAERQAERGGSSDPAMIDLRGVFEGSVGEAIRTRRAWKAATRRGAGLGSERIEEIVVEEWNRRSLAQPRGIGMDRTVDQIAHPPGMAERVRDHARLGSDLLGLPFRLRRATKGGLGQFLRRSDQGRGRIFEVATGDDLVEIALVPASSAELEHMAGQAMFLPSLIRATRAEVRVGEAGGVDVWGYPAPDDPSRTRLPLGTIPASDAAGFRRVVAIAERAMQPCVCRAVVLRRRDGGWEVMVGRPLEPLSSGHGS